MNASLDEKLRRVKWGEYKLGVLFDIDKVSGFNADRLTEGNEYDYFTRTSLNQGILGQTGFVKEANMNPAGTWSLGLLQMVFSIGKTPGMRASLSERSRPSSKFLKTRSRSLQLF